MSNIDISLITLEPHSHNSIISITKLQNQTWESQYSGQQACEYKSSTPEFNTKTPEHLLREPGHYSNVFSLAVFTSVWTKWLIYQHIDFNPKGFDTKPLRGSETSKIVQILRERPRRGPFYSANASHKDKKHLKLAQIIADNGLIRIWLHLRMW